MISYKEVLIELRNITTIDLACKTENLLEKLFWFLIGITGGIWAAYFITLQVCRYLGMLSKCLILKPRVRS